MKLSEITIHSITLENFASYRKLTFDLDKLGHLVNIYGATGSGKTTLIVDSITFCLFGNAYNMDRQGTTKLVINPMFSEAKCELEFSVSGKRYKISRIVYKDAPANAILYEEKDGNLIKKAVSVKEVDKIINSMINFDYTTFLNSIMVRQGDVMRFLEASPKERREILLKAFNLDFSKHLEKAKELRNELSKEIGNIEENIEELKKEISKEGEVRKELEEANQKIQVIKEELDNFNKNLGELENEIESLTRTKSIIENEVKQLEIIKKDIEDLTKEKSNLIKEINDYIKKLQNESEYRKDLEKYKLIREDLNKVKAILNEINLRRKEVEFLERELHNLQNELNKKQKYKIDLEEAKKAKDILAEYEKEIKEIQDEIGSKNEEIAIMRSQEEEINRILEILRSDTSTVCPVCKRDLTKEHRLVLIQDYERKIEAIRSKRIAEEKLLEEIEKKEEELNVRKKEYERKASSIELLESLASNEEELREEIKNKQIDLNKLKEEIHKLNSEDILQRYKLEARNIEQEIRKCDNEIIRISNELANINEYKKILPEREKKLKELEKKIDELNKKVQAEKDLKLQLNKIDSEIQEKNRIRKNLQERIRYMNEEIGGLNQKIKYADEQLKYIEKSKKEVEEKERDLNNKKINLRAYEIICEDIFNDRGFPLKLLKDYIEKLNDYINSYFLPKVKPDISVEIKTEQDKVEINVAQNGYVRELATYSGGEKTIIGLAFRLGIAKILSSSRLGIVPRLLIIDEGFGPLSKEFREAVLKAILELKSDYDKIFIISHVEDIQDNPIFDTVIKVWKDDNNFSQIEILR